MQILARGVNSAASPHTHTHTCGLLCHQESPPVALLAKVQGNLAKHTLRRLSVLDLPGLCLGNEGGLWHQEFVAHTNNLGYAQVIESQSGLGWRGPQRSWNGVFRVN